MPVTNRGISIIRTVAVERWLWIFNTHHADFWISFFGATLFLLLVTALVSHKVAFSRLASFAYSEKDLEKLGSLTCR